MWKLAGHMGKAILGISTFFFFINNQPLMSQNVQKEMPPCSLSLHSHPWSLAFSVSCLKCELQISPQIPLCQSFGMNGDPRFTSPSMGTL